jgi:hypothetical protein
MAGTTSRVRFVVEGAGGRRGGQKGTGRGGQKGTGRGGQKGTERTPEQA